MEVRNVSIILFYDDKGNIMIQKKPRYKQGNLHRFFGGGIEKGESPEQALIREMKEELTLDLKNFEFFKEYSHVIEELHKEIHKFMYLARIPKEKLKVNEGEEMIISWKDIPNLDFSDGDLKVLKDIREHLGF